MKAKLANSIALDLGSSKIAAIAAYVESNGLVRVLSQHIHYSEGIKSGMVIDVKGAENSVVSSIYALEESCHKNVQYASISLSGAHTKSYYIYQKIRLSTAPITKQDVQKLIQKTLDSFHVEDQEMIHYFPIEFTLDDHREVADPTGMLGRELGCRLHVIAASSSMLLNLSNCMSKCQVEISNILLGIYASGISCLTEDEQNLGSIIIDIGSRTTSFGIFWSGKLLYTGYIPVGGWHITSDIAKALGVTPKTAEKLKVLYGSAISLSAATGNLINLEEVDQSSNHMLDDNMITSYELSQIIAPRVDEILELVKAEYDKIGLDHLIARRLVITGGGSLMRGIKERASFIFGKQTRIGKPMALPGFAEDSNSCVYSVAVGMVKIHALTEARQALKTALYSKHDSGFLSKIVSWLKENV
jgi:cell division protein FtsA